MPSTPHSVPRGRIGVRLSEPGEFQNIVVYNVVRVGTDVRTGLTIRPRAHRRDLGCDVGEEVVAAFDCVDHF